VADTPKAERQQINVRLSPAERDSLEAHAFLGRTSAGVLAREIVSGWLTTNETAPGHQKALAALRERDDSTRSSAAKVTPIDRPDRYSHKKTPPRRSDS
jgi:hypothetical protein